MDLLVGVHAADHRGIKGFRPGGEPTLMGVDFFRRAMELVERYCRPGQVISDTIHTNGTLLNDDWCASLDWPMCIMGDLVRSGA
jgi:hypothetical protein